MSEKGTRRGGRTNAPLLLGKKKGGVACRPGGGKRQMNEKTRLRGKRMAFGTSALLRRAALKEGKKKRALTRCEKKEHRCQGDEGKRIWEALRRSSTARKVPFLTPAEPI